MKRLVLAILALQVFIRPALAAETPKPCTLCVGATLGSTPAGAVIPRLLETSENDLAAAGTTLDAMTPAQRAQTTVVVSFAIDPQGNAINQVEQHTDAIVAWAQPRGPFAGFGTSVATADATTAAYAIKRLAVAAQGRQIASRIVLGRNALQTPSKLLDPQTTGVEESSRASFSRDPLEALSALFEAGAQAYFDAVVTDGEAVPAIAKWLLAHDPSKRILSIAPANAPNSFFDLAQSLSRGASTAYLEGAAPADEAALAAFDAALAGDYAYDSTAKTTVLDAHGNRKEMLVLSFVRGEDLRTILVPQGDAAAPSIVALPDDRYTHPQRADASGMHAVTDVGTKNGQFLIGMQGGKAPFALTIDHVDKPDANVTKEAINVATHRGITVEEIIRNHQAYKAYQESVQPRYIARDQTNLRFSIGDGGEVIEATIAGDYFSQPGEHGSTRADWVWQDFYINGVKWKHGRIPELPLIQPEKVTQLPLDIHLTNEYRYHLVRETDLLGYHTYEVRFEPPPNAPPSLPLYRGTVWIDAHTWTRVRLSMIELNLKGEVLSNEERVDFQPFGLTNHEPLTAAQTAALDPRTVLWLPSVVEAQQVISAAGRANAVLRATDFTNFRIDPAGFDVSLHEASASDARMVRETDQGLKYLEKTAGGDRVVKEGFDTSRKFLVAGVHHDAGLDYPVVPLGGIDYFNFNLRKTGLQTNVFFAGAVLVANITDPNVGNSRTNFGADVFAIAIPTTSSVYRNGVEQKGEAVKALPTSLTLRAGHPFLQFGKIDVSLGVSHSTYMLADTTAPGYVVPADTFVISPSVDAQYTRWGWTFSAFYDYARRTNWKPWGNLAEYNPDQRSFTNYGGAIGKSFYLPKFQRIGVEVNYLDGQRLDRFSKYELGFFGSQRVHGIQSGTVRAERMTLAHLSYGFVFSDQFRLEAFYDQALIDDRTAGYHHTPFQGIGIGGQTVGPWGTLLRLDIGKSVGRNAESGFVGDVVFLKLF